MPGGPGQGELAWVWAAAHPQHLTAGGRCSSGSACPCSKSSLATWFSKAFYPPFPSCWGCLWKPFAASPQEKSFPSRPRPSIPSRSLWQGQHHCGSWAPARGSEVWLETCLCLPLSSLLHWAARARGSSSAGSSQKPRHSPEVLASPMAPRASSRRLFMTPRLLGVVKSFLETPAAARSSTAAFC